MFQLSGISSTIEPSRSVGMSPPVSQDEVTSCRVKFSPGDVVIFGPSGKRGVIIEVDEVFCGSDEEFRDLTQARGPKRAPWYYVLMENSREAQYVAECHLELDS